MAVRRSLTSVSWSSMVSALPSYAAMRGRSGNQSMAITRPAPGSQPLWRADWPTGP